MAIYDCFQYFNEDHMVDLRMNILNEHIDYFVISESTKTHQGNDKKLNFNIENFKKYEKKLYILLLTIIKMKILIIIRVVSLKLSNIKEIVFHEV